MKLDDSNGLLTRFLVSHLEPLTEADPTLLASYIIALLKNKQQSKKDLQKVCIEQLFDFLGEATEAFVVKLFSILEDDTIFTYHGETENIKPNASRDIIESQSSPHSLEKFASSNAHLFSDPEGTDDEDDDRNHKHRRRHAVGSRSFDQHVQDEDARGPYGRCECPADNGRGRGFQETHPSISDAHQGTCFSSMSSTKFDRRVNTNRDRRYGIFRRQNMDGNQWRDRGVPSRVNVPGFRCEMDNITMPGRGRGAGNEPQPLNEQRYDNSKVYSSRNATMSRVNPPWSPYGHVSGMWNGSLDQVLPLNTGLQGGGRGGTTVSVNVGVGVNLGMGMTLGRLSCPDFEEQGYCLRGDLCAMEHGANRIVVEDVQSLSKFNLPATLQSGKAVGSVAGSSLLPMPIIGETALRGGTEAADLYDPDQPLWNTNLPEVSGRIRQLDLLKKGPDEPEWESEFYGHERVSGTVGLLGSQSLLTGASVWDRTQQLARSHGREEEHMTKLLGSSGDGLNRAKCETATNIEEESTLRVSESMDRPNASCVRYHRQGSRGVSKERARRTIYVNCIPTVNNKKEQILAHFRKFGEILDIRIPANSDKAFVQFACREDAEAALASPDAVMGNRFIRLSWAYRDSKPDIEEKLVSTSVGINSGPATSEAQTSASRVQDKAIAGPIATSVSMPENVLKLGSAHSSPSSSTFVLQKKQEELELMKEEIRRKQEGLAKKRDEFSRKLEELTRQSAGIRGEVEPAQPSKRHKSEDVEESCNGTTKVETSGSSSLAGISKSSSAGEAQRQTLHPGSTSSALQTTPWTLKGPFQRPGITSGGGILYGNAHWKPTRYKLDNRTTTFRVLPPFPDIMQDIAAMKDHFLKFGEVTVIESEETESSNFEKNAVRVTFGSRQAAENAFSQGKWINGTSLQLVWRSPLPLLSPPPSATSSKPADMNKQGNSIQSPKSGSNPINEFSDTEEKKEVALDEKVVT